MASKRDDQIVSGLLWEDVKHIFDIENVGALPDVVVKETTLDDWRALSALIEERGWAYEYFQDGESRDVPPVADMLREKVAVQLNVWPAPEVLVIFRPYHPESIDFDIDIREMQNQEQLDVLLDLLTAIGRKLNKAVLMALEGSSTPMLGFDPIADRVVLYPQE